MDIEYINFELIRNNLRIQDSSKFASYLKDTYKDLAVRSEKNKKLGISKLTFYDYFNLPLIISEKVFNSFDKDKNGYLNHIEFIEGMLKLFLGDFEETIRSVFDIYDFDNDSFINCEDVRIILSFLPLKEQNWENDFNYQMESQSEIDEILNNTFKNEIELNFEKYRDSIKKEISDSYLQLISFIYKNIPFSLDAINLYQISQNHIEILKKSTSVLIPIPKFAFHLSPFEDLINYFDQNYLQETKREEYKTDIREEHKKYINKDYCEMIRMGNSILIDNQESWTKSTETFYKNGKIIFDSPSKYLKYRTYSRSLNEKDLSKITNSKTLSDKKLNRQKVHYENIIFKITEHKQFKKYWLVLQGKEIYYYKSSSKEELKGIHNLTGVFMKEGPEVFISEIKFFSFSLIFYNKVLLFFVKDKSNYDEWIKHLKKEIGYQNFFEFYSMKENIGIGKFGHVKLGIHNSTFQNVAIKIINKSSMTPIDLELVKSEIDIMKLVKHPNVVRLLDHFENSDYVYIVMELFQGGDLATYISKNHSKIEEAKFSNIMYQVSSGLNYLHQYGILHRDLKPENIMLVDQSSNPIIKITDFGLSKVLGPKERVSDGFGTLSFVAPEVLLRKPYNKQIDIWSLGILMYYGLSGTLPFYDESNLQSIVAKKIVNNEVLFPASKWIGRSKEVMDLIKKCLIKEPEKRIKLKEFINHEWITLFNK